MYSTHQKIVEEIQALGEFYGINTTEFTQFLSPSALSHYVELVLEENAFSVVLGGIAQEAQLLDLARTHHFALPMREAFLACTQQFPSRMLYTKFPLQPDSNNPGAMYVLVLEPWEVVCDFLDTLPVDNSAVQALRLYQKDSPFCFILAFTTDAANPALLKIKTYELIDRVGKAEPASTGLFLQVHHLGHKGFLPACKVYRAKAKPQDFVKAKVSRWQEIARFVQTEKFAYQNYALLQSESEGGELKMYVFRHDTREGKYYNPRTYNYYVEEGQKLIELQRYDEAQRAFENAVNYEPLGASAINGLGFCYMYNKRYIEGIQLVLKAKELNPHISNVIWSWGLPLENMEENIASLSQQIALSPSAALHHQRGIYYFQSRAYPEALADLEKVVDQEPLNAEAYNNLGGIYLKLGRFADAVKSCNIALSINRQTSTSNLGIAREVLRLIHETEQNPSEIAFINLGKFLYQLDMFEAAEANFFKAAVFEQMAVEQD